jgi:hypothetical protein
LGRTGEGREIGIGTYGIGCMRVERGRVADEDGGGKKGVEQLTQLGKDRGRDAGE